MAHGFNIDWNSVNNDLNEMANNAKDVSAQLKQLAEILGDRIDTSDWSQLAEQIENASYRIKSYRYQ